jgi:RHS repeat-associated protein
LASASPTSGGTEYYGYAPDNKRIYRWNPTTGTEEWTFYGARGERIGSFALNTSGTYYFSATQTNLWFAGQLISNANGLVFRDRLGSDRETSAEYYPYGDEVTSTANGTEKFGTYFRDSFTTLDYADQRYYASSYGRFNTADQYMAKANGANNPRDPGTWNRYAYTAGDPVNRADPSGQNFLSCTTNCGGGIGPGGIGGGNSCGGPNWPGQGGIHLGDSGFGGGEGGDEDAFRSAVSPATPVCGPYPTPPLPVCPGLPVIGGLPGGSPSNQVAQNVALAQQTSASLMALATSVASADPGGLDPYSLYLSYMANWLYGQFSNNGPWDYKVNQGLASQNPGGHQSVINFGNFDFGAVMEGLGLSYYETQNAAGTYQFYISTFHGGAPGQGTPIFQYPFGDQVADAQVVQTGFNYEMALQAGCK